VGRKNQPADEEIATDEEGRVLVKFHWDRRGEVNGPDEEQEDRDKEQSCFIRVAQVWAGARWGAMHIPRIGQEVIVDFLEGDPDRPIITGRVYNGDNKPPYPGHPTQSGIKSRSTKGGTADNFNEIRFEDQKGSEELFIQAEKDQTTNVKHDQTITVGGDRTVTVTGNETVTIDKDLTVHVKGNQSVTVDGQGQGPIHHTISVKGKHGIHASDTIDVDAPTHIKLECGGSSILIEPGKITLNAGGGAQVILDANVFAKASGGAQVTLDANVFAKASGGANVLLDANVLAKSNAGSHVTLDANATMESGGDANVNGANVTLTGTQKVSAGGGKTSTLELQASGAAVHGTTATLSGSSVAEVTGGEVKIN
jgi:type VI secretion system secreted protein VgrG